MSIKDKLERIKKEIPEHVTLVAVSKTKPNEDLLEPMRPGKGFLGKTKCKRWSKNGSIYRKT